MEFGNFRNNFVGLLLLRIELYSPVFFHILMLCLLFTTANHSSISDRSFPAFSVFDARLIKLSFFAIQFSRRFTFVNQSLYFHSPQFFLGSVVNAFLMYEQLFFDLGPCVIYLGNFASQGI